MNNQYTVRIRPYQDESLASFLRRFSDVNGVSFLSFWNSLKHNKTHYAQNDDVNLLDTVPENAIDLDNIAKVTGVEVEQLLQGTLFYALRRFSLDEKLERSRIASGLIREVLHYCSFCLDEKPYHRLIWKIKGIEACFKHRCALLDCCLHCKKKIKYRDLVKLDSCPYCEKELYGPKKNLGASFGHQSDVEWILDAWNRLLEPNDVNFPPQEVALRILFILNDFVHSFDKEKVKMKMKEPGKLPTLLQHARGSLSQKRALHISFVLEVLKENNISMKMFLDMKVPKSFVESILIPVKTKKERAFCLAPWCSDYMVEGTLVKTGTSIKNKNNGQIMSYYLVCQSCGCEYAFDQENNLIERTYFIKGYNLLKDYDRIEGFNSISRRTGLTVDQIRRCLAYFRSRDELSATRHTPLKANELTDFSLSPDLLQRFVEAIKNGMPLKKIESWDCWSRYDHFLTYRFHQRVMEQLIRQKRSSFKRVSNTDRMRDVIKIVDSMFERDDDITVEKVAKRAGVCVQTLRNWGCCPYINKMKKGQFEYRILNKKETFQLMIDDYFNNLEGKALSSLLYEYLGIKRTLLWRFAPELTSFINDRVKMHNKALASI